MAKRALVVYRELDKAQPYAVALENAGVEPLLVFAETQASLENADGLLLMGGDDVNPKLYGAPRHPETEDSDDARDSLEFNLIREALDKDLPLFGICRGLQIFNVFHGGTLIQHLPDTNRHVRRPADPGEPAHQVCIEPDTFLASLVGKPVVEVNSRHHQAADIIGDGLRVAARDTADHTIEALERPDRRFALAVQWHPENQVFRNPDQFKLFQAFAKVL